MARERDFQAKLIRDIQEMFPGCVVLKNDPNYIQGFPDLTIFCGPRWAVLEVKRSAGEPHRPNQDFYIQWLSKMGYASFVYPENREEVLHELQQTFQL